MGHTVNCISQRFFKSAANVDPQQEQPLLPADKRASTARSENCILITVAEDLDYDALVSYISISMSNKNSKHICPRAVVGLEVVTIKTKGCIFTYGLKRCQKYDILKNWPSPLRNPIFSSYTY